MAESPRARKPGATPTPFAVAAAAFTIARAPRRARAQAGALGHRRAAGEPHRRARAQAGHAGTAVVARPRAA
jgi:hypothetical protein